MLVQLHVRDLRTYHDTHLTLTRGSHLLVGPNAIGKTSLIEALSVACTGHSFRAAHLPALIRHGAQGASVYLLFEREGVEQEIRLVIEERQRRCWLNVTPLPSLSHLAGQLPFVLLAPQDIELVRGDPQGRRQFLDLHLSQVDPLYHHYLLRYRRAVRQRNVLLKGRSLATAPAWEHEMARCGVYLARKRAEAVELLSGLVQESLSHLVQGEDRVALEYVGALPTDQLSEEAFRRMWEQQRPREADYGVTGAGPHRDDLRILLNGHLAREFASEGEARTLASSLRMAQIEELARRTGRQPLVCVDDLGMGLDPHRVERLISHIGAHHQSICTAPSWPGDRSWPGALYTFQKGAWLAAP